MGSVAPPYKGLPSMPMNLVSVHRFFFTASCAIHNPLQHVKELSMCKCNTLILHLSIVLSYFNLNLTQIGLIVN